MFQKNLELPVDLLGQFTRTFQHIGSLGLDSRQLGEVGAGRVVILRVRLRVHAQLGHFSLELVDFRLGRHLKIQNLLRDVENVFWVGVLVLLEEVADVVNKLADLVVVLGNFTANLFSL